MYAWNGPLDRVVFRLVFIVSVSCRLAITYPEYAHSQVKLQVRDWSFCGLVEKVWIKDPGYEVEELVSS